MNLDEMVITYLKGNPGNTQSWEYWYNIYKHDEHKQFNQNIERKAKKFCKPEVKSYLWLTLSPAKYLRNMDYNATNLQALGDWCRNWFENNPKFYGDYAWVIEVGSEGNHLHVHAVLDMKSSHKHAQLIKKSWNKHFPNNQLLTSVDANSKAYREKKKKGEYCYKRFDDPLYLQERLTYMCNEKKGCHENLFDTGVRGSRGFLTDVI